MPLGAVQPIAVWPDWEDPLDILPHRKPQDFLKEETIYTPGDLARSLYLVVDGMVKVSRISHSGRETVLDFCGRDTFFGESCLLVQSCQGEMAVAQDDSSIMEWSASDLYEITQRLPALGPSLLGMMARKLRDAEDRVESLATDQIPQRLVKVVLRLADSFGEPLSGSKIRLKPVTHELLARHVGTSREIITQHMSQLRRKGLLTYDRSGMEFDPHHLRQVLLNN
jgi:CRP-like cAMP-binding protein